MTVTIGRRELLAALGGAAAWPLAARAQQPAMPIVGFLGSESPVRWATYVRAFQQGLREVGYAEGRNVAIEYRWAEGQNERMSGLLADLLRRPVSVLAVPGSTPAALAAKAATTTVPIVFAIATDPVQIGLVTSLNRPGGNVTGVVTLNVEIAGRPGSPPCDGDRYPRQRAGDARGQSGNCDDPNRVRCRGGSGPTWSCG